MYFQDKHRGTNIEKSNYNYVSVGKDSLWNIVFFLLTAVWYHKKLVYIYEICAFLSIIILAK